MGGEWPLLWAIAGFVAAACAIAVAGSGLARTVDVLADRTGIGEALAGAVLLAGATSLAGMIVSVIAAAEGDASLAIGNSLGGIGAQTAFIVAADAAYRRANLEHAAASLTNVFSSLLMVVLLAIVICAMAVPGAAVFELHPGSIVLVAAYVYGLRLARAVGDRPMWEPRRTSETRLDEPEQASSEASGRRLWLRFAVLAVIVSGAGWIIAGAGLSIVARTGLSATVVGTFFTSIATSLPELVTAVAAVRAGALTLAVGGIIGGNTFDVLFIAASDVAFPGSLYEAATDADLFVAGWTTVLVAVAGTGLIRRERSGIGFEGGVILLVYLAGIAVLSTIS